MSSTRSIVITVVITHSDGDADAQIQKTTVDVGGHQSESMRTLMPKKSLLEGSDMFLNAYYLEEEEILKLFDKESCGVCGDELEKDCDPCCCGDCENKNESCSCNQCSNCDELDGDNCPCRFCESCEERWNPEDFCDICDQCKENCGCTESCTCSKCLCASCKKPFREQDGDECDECLTCNNCGCVPSCDNYEADQAERKEDGSIKEYDDLTS